MAAGRDGDQVRFVRDGMDAVSDMAGRMACDFFKALGRGVSPGALAAGILSGADPRETARGARLLERGGMAVPFDCAALLAMGGDWRHLDALLGGGWLPGAAMSRSGFSATGWRERFFGPVEAGAAGMLRILAAADVAGHGGRFLVSRQAGSWSVDTFGFLLDGLAAGTVPKGTADLMSKARRGGGDGAAVLACAAAWGSGISAGSGVLAALRGDFRQREMLPWALAAGYARGAMGEGLRREAMVILSAEGGLGDDAGVPLAGGLFGTVPHPDRGRCCSDLGPAWSRLLQMAARSGKPAAVFPACVSWIGDEAAGPGTAVPGGSKPPSSWVGREIVAEMSADDCGRLPERVFGEWVERGARDAGRGDLVAAYEERVMGGGRRSAVVSRAPGL